MPKTDGIEAAEASQPFRYIYYYTVPLLSHTLTPTRDYLGVLSSSIFLCSAFPYHSSLDHGCCTTNPRFCKAFNSNFTPTDAHYYPSNYIETSPSHLHTALCYLRRTSRSLPNTKQSLRKGRLVATMSCKAPPFNTTNLPLLGTAFINQAAISSPHPRAPKASLICLRLRKRHHKDPF